jgi:hypothetical protein
MAGLMLASPALAQRPERDVLAEVRRCVVDHTVRLGRDNRKSAEKLVLMATRRCETEWRNVEIVLDRMTERDPLLALLRSRTEVRAAAIAALREARRR